MYLHRPDIPSLLFGAMFVVTGMVALFNPTLPVPLAAVLPVLAITAALSIVGRLATGNVHRRAARRLAARGRLHVGPGVPAEWDQEAWWEGHDALGGGSRSGAAPDRAPSAAERDPAAADLSSPVLDDPLLDDPMFAPPMDPEELDRVYRETFGDDGTGVNDSGEDGSGGR